MYHFKETILKNKTMEKKVLHIVFDDPQMEIIGAFLNDDASMLDYQVLTLIDDVLAGKSKVEKTSGNRCALTITQETTVVEDLLEDMFDDMTTYPSYEIETKQLQALLVMWKDKRETFATENKAE